MPNELTDLYLDVLDFIEPLRTRLDEPDALEYLFYRYGWDATMDDAAFTRFREAATIIAPIEQFAQTAEALRTKLDSGSDLDAFDIEALAGSAGVLIKALAEFGMPNLSGLADPLDRPEFWESVAEQIFDDLLEQYLRVYQPLVFLVLRMWNVIRYDPSAATGPGRVSYTRVWFDWDQAAAMLTDPLQALKQGYHWGDATQPFDYEGALDAIRLAFTALRVPAAPFSPALVTAPIPGDASRSAPKDVLAVRATLLERDFPDENAFYRLGLEVYPALRSTDLVPTGLMVKPILEGGAGATLPLNSLLSFTVATVVSADDAVGLALFPGEVGLVAGAPAVGASLSLQTTGTGPWYALGNARTSHLALSGFLLRASVEGSVDDPEFKLEASFPGAGGQPGVQGVVNLSGADDFVQGTVKSDALTFSFAPDVVWSSKAGLMFSGKPTISLDFPLSASVGPVTLTDLSVALSSAPKTTSASGIELRVGLGVRGTLGPITLAISQLGFAFVITPYARADVQALPAGAPAPTLGAVDVELQFAPPTGVGISVDAAGLISGGGFLEHTGDEYAGAFDLSISGYTVKAYGLIQTTLPTGQPGYSFVAVLSVEFIPGIDLPFDFTLHGVGGFIGVHRTVAVDAIEAALWAHHLDGLLFPADPIAAAPQLIPALGSYFPAAEGRYVFGPLAKIGWAADIVTGEAALLLELPEPLKVLLIGDVQVGVPSDSPQLVLHISFAGGIDMGKQLAFFDAMLHDSRLESYPISGDLAFRYSWGGQAVFALALGGFNPHFQPPAGFPTLKRLAISISSSVARIEAQSYLALTSNTLQFGARVELTAGTGTFNVHGWLGFDALCERNPLAFEFDLSAGVDLRAGTDVLASVHLDGKLSGPTPWHIAGKASLSLLRRHRARRQDVGRHDGRASRRRPAAGAHRRARRPLELELSCPARRPYCDHAGRIACRRRGGGPARPGRHAPHQPACRAARPADHAVRRNATRSDNHLHDRLGRSLRQRNHAIRHDERRVRAGAVPRPDGCREAVAAVVQRLRRGSRAWRQRDRPRRQRSHTSGDHSDHLHHDHDRLAAGTSEADIPPHGHGRARAQRQRGHPRTGARTLSPGPGHAPEGHARRRPVDDRQHGRLDRPHRHPNRREQAQCPPRPPAVPRREPGRRRRPAGRAHRRRRMIVGANYAFFSVLRRGLAALIAPGAAATDPRVDVAVTLAAGGAPVTAPPLALRGPGDVAGFDTSCVRRTWPTAGAVNAESNYFPLIELSDADLPWRYSPAPSDGDRLTPWLCLIALENGEIEDQVAATSGRPLGAITVADSGRLPDLTQSWAWAHAQLLVAQDPPPADYDAASTGAILTQAPSQTTARLLCPRQLQPRTGYQAFLVPTFERGRLAGVGEPTTGIDRLAPAWQPGQTSVLLPAYFSWSFQTGDLGDFQSLVTKLKPIAHVPDAVWQRELAVSPPGSTPPNWQVVELESALLPIVAPVSDGRSPTGPPAPAVIPDWQTIDEHGFTTALAARTDAPGTKLDPPLYGRWLAAANKLGTDTPGTPWFHQLNADPRARVAAGLGTVVVQTEQQQLLAGAWAQVAGIRAVNERLRLSQLARELALRLYARHLAPLDSDSLIQVSSPLHGRVRLGGATVAAQLAVSPIVPGALAPAWRRTARPLGTLAVRQARDPSATAPATPGALARMNTGALSVVPAQAMPFTGTTGTAARLGDLAKAFSRAAVEPQAMADVTPPASFRVMTFSAAGAATGPGTPAAEALHAPAVTSAAAPHVAPPIVGPPVAPSFAGPPTKPVPGANNAFVEAAGQLMSQLAQPPSAGTTWVEADLGAATSAIQAALDPLLTIQQPLVAGLAGVDAGPRRTDSLEPVMAAPAFPQPMYGPLVEVGREWLLPGLDQMDPNSIALFATNWSFVESFLVGLNHELARKLLWNGYPTDQRGTYFRRFWDIRGSGDNGGEVGPIHLWTGPLGHNEQLAGDPLILLVRGELIRRYPNVVVYAADAVANGGVREPGPNEIDPIFFALIEPDVALFGFDLDPAAVRGDPGTFFILQEHPSEPRFGLEPAGTSFGAQAASWAAIGWDALAASAPALAALVHIDLDATLPLDPAAPDDKGAVWHANGTPPSRAADLAHLTLRQPARLAVHGSMLVPDPTAPPSPPPGGGP
jgi:Family of unknown function (DUF6603)